MLVAVRKGLMEAAPGRGLLPADWLAGWLAGGGADSSRAPPLVCGEGEGKGRPPPPPPVGGTEAAGAGG